jgi:hypothetical protein
MSEGQSQRLVASSAQHRQEAEVAAAEERERAATETAATATRAARLAMVKLPAARTEVEAAAAADVARATVAELEALRASSTDNSISVDGDKDNELKLAREAAREQTAQWAAARGAVAIAQTGADAPVALRAGAHVAAVPTTAAADQIGADAPAAGLTEITTFTGDVALPSRTGTIVHVGSSSIRRRRLLRGSTGAGCPHCCSSVQDVVLAFQEVDCQGGLRRHHYGMHR